MADSVSISEGVLLSGRGGRIDLSVDGDSVDEHEAAADPHAQYQKESEKGQADGYASLGGDSLVPDAQIPSTVARDSEVSSAVAAHESDTSVHGIADTTVLATDAEVAAAVSAHAGAADPHTGYQLESGKGAANGYAPLDASGLILDSDIPTGVTRDSELVLAEGLFTSGLYYGHSAPITAVATVTPSQSGLQARRFVVRETTTFDRIGCEVTTLAASSAVRLGIYADSGALAPGALVLDAGTVASTTTGVKEVTISEALDPGVYWLVNVSQGGTPTLRSTTSPDSSIGSSALNAIVFGAVCGYSVAGVTGALPDPFGSPGTSAGSMPWVALRAA